eukprot:GGOE01014451.1.p1 GENE.GGOE01014451.1~~GGOE01014451.1.p1  ORF type:complete len:326 (+),score=96.57 GGOE01014451.1:113-1090(+)
MMDIRQRQTTSPPPREHCIDMDGAGARHPWAPMLRKVMWLGVVGLGLSVYLIREHYAEGGTMCDINTVLSCSRVNQSRFAELLGVPVAVWGVLWNALLVSVARHGGALLHRNALKDVERIKSYLFFLDVWALAGVCFVVYFVAAEVILHALCVFCTLVHVVILSVFLHVHGAYRQARISTGVLDHAVVLRAWLGGFAAVSLLLLLLFNFPIYLHKAPVEAQPADVTTHDINDFARCIGRNGFVMFGSMSCGHCLQQKALFGEAFQFIPFVSCASGSNCTQHRVTGYPTWLQLVNDREQQRHVGILSLATLGNLTRCILDGKKVQP